MCFRCRGHDQIHPAQAHDRGTRSETKNAKIAVDKQRVTGAIGEDGMDIHGILRQRLGAEHAHYQDSRQ